MRANEFDAVYKSTDLFAVADVTIEEEVPGHLQRSKKPYGGGYTCPLGLVKAKVLDTKAEWHSMESFGCAPGASEHEVTHRNGVLVEITRKEAENITPRRYATFESRTSSMRMIVSKKAIIMPWSDYQPVRDARRKSQRESERRQERMAKAINAVGAVRGSWHEYTVGDSRDRIFDERRAEVDVPLIVVERLAELLDSIGDTPGAMEQGLRGLKELIDGMPAVREAVSEAMNPPKKKRGRKKS